MLIYEALICIRVLYLGRCFNFRNIREYGTASCIYVKCHLFEAATLCSHIRTSLFLSFHNGLCPCTFGVFCVVHDLSEVTTI